MRRADREISDFAQMLTIMDACECLRLGFIDGDEVYMVPLNFGYEVTANRELTLYCHGARAGRKMDLACKRNRAGFEMDCRHDLITAETACDFSYLYASVMGSGTVSVLDAPADKIHGLTQVMRHYAPRREFHFMPEMVRDVGVIALQVTSWSCKAHS